MLQKWPKNLIRQVKCIEKKNLLQEMVEARKQLLLNAMESKMPKEHESDNEITESIDSVESLISPNKFTCSDDLMKYLRPPIEPKRKNVSC